MLKTSLLGDELHEKVYITLSYLLSVWVFKPRFVASEVEFCDWLYVCTEKSFEDNLSYVLIFIFIVAEAIHVQNFDRRAILSDLTEKTGYRGHSCFTKAIPLGQFQVSKVLAHVGQPGDHLVLKWF